MENRFEARLDTDARARLAAYAASARWPSGFQVYQRGAPADGLFIVLSGSVVLRTRLKGGRAFVPMIATAGEVFGAEGLTPGAMYQTDARAEPEAETLHLGRRRLRTLLREQPADAAELLTAVGVAHACLLDRLRELAALSVEQRLYAAVARLRETRADAPPNGAVALDGAGYRLLCEMVGATRESVSLVVNRLVAEGHAARDGTTVSIVPPADLGGAADLLLIAGDGRLPLARDGQVA